MSLNDMSCINDVVTLDMYDIYEILSLLGQDPKYKKYAELKAKRILKDYEFQQKNK